MTVELDSCAEWRALASCELDGELSELDTVRLDHHLGDCAACRTWVAEVRDLTTALRSAELEAPDRSFDLTATWRRMFRTSTVTAAVAASAAAAALAILPLAMPSNGPTVPRAAQDVKLTKRSACPDCLARKFVLMALNGELDRQQAPGHGPVVS